MATVAYFGVASWLHFGTTDVVMPSASSSGRGDRRSDRRYYGAEAKGTPMDLRIKKLKFYSAILLM